LIVKQIIRGSSDPFHSTLLNFCSGVQEKEDIAAQLKSLAGSAGASLGASIPQANKVTYLHPNLSDHRLGVLPHNQTLGIWNLTETKGEVFVCVDIDEVAIR